MVIILNFAYHYRKEIAYYSSVFIIFSSLMFIFDIIDSFEIQCLYYTQWVVFFNN